MIIGEKSALAGAMFSDKDLNILEIFSKLWISEDLDENIFFYFFMS